MPLETNSKVVSTVVPTLVIGDNFFHGVPSIAKKLLKVVKFKGFPEIKNEIKFTNYLNFIEQYFDYPLNFLLQKIYQESD